MHPKAPYDGIIRIRLRVKGAYALLSADFRVSSPVVFSSFILYLKGEFVKKNRSIISYYRILCGSYSCDTAFWQRHIDKG